MYVPKRTWIEYGPLPARSTRAVRLRVPATLTSRRGVGQAPCPSLEQLAGVVDLADPCQAALAGGQIPTETTVPVVSGPVPAAAAPGGVCFSSSFPWVGQNQADGTCKPALAVPSPWGTILTVGVGGLLIYQLIRGRR